MNRTDHSTLKNELRLNKKFLFYDFLLTFILFAILPISKYLPKEVGWENGLIENAQVALLCFNALIAAYFRSPNFKNLGKAISIGFLLMAAREISWGRTLLTPTMITEMGPKFPPMKSFSFYPLVYLLIALVVMYILWTVYKNFKLSGFLQIPLPVNSLIVLVLGIAMHYISEHVHIPLFAGPRGQIIEETAELVAYSEMLIITIYYGYHYTKNHGKASVVSE